MSEDAQPTLIRAWRSETDLIAYFEVDDWEAQDGYARFTIPRESSFAQQLLDAVVVHLQLVVMDSEEIEWTVRQMESATVDLDAWPKPPRAVWRVSCRSRREHMRLYQVPDEWLRLYGEIAR